MINIRLIDTAILAGSKEEWTRHFIQLVPMQRAGEASEVANLIAFLSSSRASFITGANMFVDGGWSIQ
jgi:meso-butanediol dehydrogenase / (S,S)-butanediol dehydrogenase / diacetyl reductase